MIFQDFEETFTFSNHTHCISYSFRYSSIISTGVRTEIILLRMLNLWLLESFLDLESPAKLPSNQNFDLREKALKFGTALGTHISSRNTATAY